MSVICLKCDEDLEKLLNWDNLGEVITCPNCGEQYTVCYDEKYDGKEEQGFFYIEKIEVGENNG